MTEREWPDRPDSVKQREFRRQQKIDRRRRSRNNEVEATDENIYGLASIQQSIEEDRK